MFILLLLLPVTALAAAEGAPSQLYVGDQQVSSGNDITYWTTDKSTGGLTKYEGNDDNWNVKYDPTTVTLTLSGATIQGGSIIGSAPFGSGIYALSSSNQPVALTIELIGKNTITGNYGIYVDAQQGGTVGTNASLLIQNSGDDGSLEVSGSSYGIYVKSGTGDASLTIKNASVDAKTTQIYSSYAGVCVQSGASTTGSPNISLSVNGGSLTASGTGSNDGILFYVGSSQATGATTSLTVSENAIVDAKTGGIKALKISETLPTPTPTGNNSSGIVFDGSTGTVYGTVELQNDLTIGAGETLTVPSGSSLNCNNNLTNNGTINVESGGNLEGEPTSGTGTVVKAPTITTQPTSQTVNEGETATFTVVATGENLSYQWQQSTDNGQSWTDISEAKAATYTTVATTTDMSGNQYRCVVSNSAGSVTSNAVTLTVEKKTVPVTGVTLNPTSLSLFTGESETLTATVEPGNATNKAVTWSTSDNTVATVDENGTVTAVGAGEATITVTTEDGSKTATCTVTVTVPVTGVKLNKETLELFTDGSETLTATVEPGNATNKNVTWSSSDETIATVDNNGTVTAVGAGEATITATAGGITATCVVHVRKPATVEASGSTNLSFTTDRNEFTLTAIVYGENLSQEPNCWEWTVANTDVVSLSDTPNLRSGSVASSRKAFTIKGTGTTTITATYDDGTYRGSVDFKVRISKPTPPDPISYYNIYVEDVCDGVEVSTSKQVVREGGSITVYVEKDTARYTFDNFKVYYKRSYYGTWDELKEGTQPGEYPIKNIWTHIYIKAEGAEEKEDPTGIESIEGVKVYTKDGSLYVQTPQREQVIIVSMTGAVVKNEEQVGLKQYHGLQPGIYIVRVGETAYKVRL